MNTKIAVRLLQPTAEFFSEFQEERMRIDQFDNRIVVHNHLGFDPDETYEPMQVLGTFAEDLERLKAEGEQPYDYEAKIHLDHVRGIMELFEEVYE